MSPEILDLCQYVVTHRHEIQTSLDERERIDDAVVRGRVDARKTVLRRALVGHPTSTVFYEPIKDYTVGANHVLVWTLQHAARVIGRIHTSEIAGSSYMMVVDKMRSLLSGVRKLEGVRQALAETNFEVRPSARALAQAAVARRPLYRKAYVAYRLLQSLERGDERSIIDLLRATLIGPLENWRRFEMVLAMGMASTLASQLQCSMRLRSILPGEQGPLFDVGKYSIFWQTRTTSFIEPALEPSELMCKEIQASYGLEDGDDRPDVVVLDRESARVVAIGEAKYFTDESEGWRSAFRAATTQIVRYARGYAVGPELPELIGRSIIGVWAFPTTSRPTSPLPGHVPIAVDFSDLEKLALGDWTARVANRGH